jgi:hypothetical protein
MAGSWCRVPLGLVQFAECYPWDYPFTNHTCLKCSMFSTRRHQCFFVFEISQVAQADGDQSFISGWLPVSAAAVRSSHRAPLCNYYTTP